MPVVTEVRAQSSLAPQDNPDAEVTLKRVRDGVIEIHCDHELFARFNSADHAKPIFFPVMAPGNIPITRSYPMKMAEGEAHDHPHHKSVWFAHGDVNGSDFWSEKQAIVTKSLELQDRCFVVVNHWQDEHRTLVVETTTYAFGARADLRWIDADISLRPGDDLDNVTFGDTKEGTFAIRTHPNLRLTNNPAQGVTQANGQAINSEGIKGKDIWGKKAAWVYYWGQINDQHCGVAIFDHAQNLRHPTTWHAREYGLVAANPFGLHHFRGQTPGQGDVTIDRKSPLRLRYRLLFVRGTLEPAQLQELFQAYVATD